MKAADTLELVNAVYPLPHEDGKQERMLEILANTAACLSASTSDFVGASMTDTVTKHPSSMTAVSAGRWSVPHVSTSVTDESAARRVKMNE